MQMSCMVLGNRYRGFWFAGMRILSWGYCRVFIGVVTMRFLSRTNMERDLNEGRWDCVEGGIM